MDGKTSAAAVEAPPTVKMFDAILTGPLAQFVNLSSQIGGDVQELGALTKAAFDAQREFLWKVAGMTKAAGEKDMASLLQATSEKIMNVQEMKSSKRTSPFFNHLSAISEGIPALGWVTVSPTPGPHVKEMSDASQFYTNRILKDYREKEQVHVDWVKAWLQTLTELHQYVKQNHTTGLTWNSAPGSAPPSGGSAPKVAGGAPPPPPAGGPPPPPPPLPANLLADMASGKGAAKDDDGESRAALFADINKGLDITKKLKKVTPDMQTHKNPSLRLESAVPGDDKERPPLAPKPAHLSNGHHGAGAPASKAATAAPPKLELEGGKKWIVENFKNNPNIVIQETDMKHVVYIWKCENSVIQIKGKVNSITMDSCKKTSVVFDNLVGQMEIINCQSAQVQTMGAMPTLTIQKTDGCQVYLSKEALNAEIVTGKSSEMNILVPDENGEFREFPVPEQYKTVWTGKKLETTVVDIA